VQFDVALILKHLSRDSTGNSKVLFEHLNRSIKQFHFLGPDANDKPGVVSDGKTVGGNAVQVWCLLRLLPILLYDSVCMQYQAWQMLILLREIVELICAPKVSFAQILYLNRLIQEYIEDRSRLFPSVPLRPKHHFFAALPLVDTNVWATDKRVDHAHGK